MSTTETTTSSPALPAAWYRDPSGRHERRWWDGTAWTDRVVDADHESSDPPLRSRPVVTEPDPTDTHEPAPVTATEPDADREPEADPEPEPELFVGLDEARAGRRPPAERASTGTHRPPGPGRTGLVLGILAIVAVTASLLWGFQNHRTASQWRDRGEALQEELVTRASNADALQDALGDSASRGARLADDQQAFAELHDAVVATVEQIRQCARDLNGILNFLATTGGDPTSLVNQANDSCSAAAVNGEGLIAILDEVSGQ